MAWWEKRYSAIKGSSPSPTPGAGNPTVTQPGQNTWWYKRYNSLQQSGTLDQIRQQREQMTITPVIKQEPQKVPVQKDWKAKLFDGLDRLKESAVIGGQQALGGLKNAAGVIISRDIERQKLVDEGKEKPSHPLQVSDQLFMKRMQEQAAKGDKKAQEYIDNKKKKSAETEKWLKGVSEDWKKSGNEDFKKAAERKQKLDERGKAEGFQWLAEQVAQATPSFLSTFGLAAVAGVVTKNPQAALALGFSTTYVQTTGQAYQDAKDFGVSDKKAEDVANVAGVASGMLNMLPIANFLQRTPQGEAIKKAIVKEVVVSTIKQGSVEAATSSLDQILQNAIKKTYNENQQLFEGVPESALVGGVLGGVSGAVGDIGIAAEEGRTAEVVKKANEQIKEAVNTPKEKRTPLQQEIVDTFYTKELTPQQVSQMVLQNELESTPLGKTLLKQAAEAAQQKKNVSIIGAEDTDDVQIKIVDKSVYDVDEKSLKTGALKRAVDDMATKAASYDPEFKKGVDSVAKELGYEVKHGPVKQSERMYEKVVNDYSGDLKGLRDTNRSTIVIDDPANLSKVEEAVRKQFGNVERVKNKFSGEGYQSAIINIKTPDGTIAEIQLTTPEFLKAKNELGGHELYKKVRVKAEDWEKSEIEMNRLYAEARASLERRLKSSSEISTPSDRALNGEKSLPSDVTPKTSLDSESKSTLTNTSSTSKNLGNREVEAIKSPPNNTSVADTQETIKTKTKELNEAYQKTGDEKHGQAMYEIFAALETAEAGQRIFTEDGVIGVESSFPDWIPSELRRKDLIEKVIGNIWDADTNELSYPDGNRPNQRALADAIFDAFDEKLGVDTKGIRSEILSAYETGEKAKQQKTETKPKEPIRESTTRGSETRSEVNPQKPVGDGKAKESRLFERVKETLGQEYENQKREYNQMSLEKDAQKAVKFLEENPDAAIRIAKGIEEPPAGQTANGIGVAAAIKASAEGKTKLAADLWTAVSLRSTRLGQEIVSLRGNMNDNSPQNFIKQVIARRLNQMGANIMNADNIADAGDRFLNSSEATAKQRAIKKIDNQVKKVKETLTKEQSRIRLAQDIIEQLKCK